MKFMELPEKIYLQRNTTTDLYEELWPEWFEARSTEDDIEYIRSDKVVEWMDEHVPTKFEDMQNYMNQFKKDFGL